MVVPQSARRTPLAPVILTVVLILAGAARADRAPIASRAAAAAALPETMLWAWERPEDLRFIDAAHVGVAFLARTIDLDGDAVRVRPRLQPLRLTPGTHVVAVVRVDHGRNEPTLSGVQRTLTAEAIAGAHRDGVDGIQIDFDARASERDFYRALIADVRRQLPANLFLSMTALASWCLADGWIAELPVDEAVPMLFRMGPDAAAVARHLHGGGDFQVALCRASVGVSSDEPGIVVPAGRRAYIFNPRSWTPATLSSFQQGGRR